MMGLWSGVTRTWIGQFCSKCEQKLGASGNVSNQGFFGTPSQTFNHSTIGTTMPFDVQVQVHSIELLVYKIMNCVYAINECNSTLLILSMALQLLITSM